MSRPRADVNREVRLYMQVDIVCRYHCQRLFFLYVYLTPQHELQEISQGDRINRGALGLPLYLGIYLLYILKFNWRSFGGSVPALGVLCTVTLGSNRHMEK